MKSDKDWESFLQLDGNRLSKTKQKATKVPDLLTIMYSSIIIIL